MNNHADLPSDHRKIILAGTLTDRESVAGMTREQIILTMGVEPTQYTTINSEDAWVWVKKQGSEYAPWGESERSGGTTSGSFSNAKREREPAPVKKVQVRTTVFF